MAVELAIDVAQATTAPIVTDSTPWPPRSCPRSRTVSRWNSRRNCGRRRNGVIPRSGTNERWRRHALPPGLTTGRERLERPFQITRTARSRRRRIDPTTVTSPFSNIRDPVPQASRSHRGRFANRDSGGANPDANANFIMFAVDSHDSQTNMETRRSNAIDRFHDFPRDERFLLSDPDSSRRRSFSRPPGLADEVVVVPMPEDPDRVCGGRDGRTARVGRGVEPIDAVEGRFVPTTPAERNSGSTASDLGPECVGPWIAASDRPPWIRSRGVDDHRRHGRPRPPGRPTRSPRVEVAGRRARRAHPDLQEWINLLPVPTSDRRRSASSRRSPTPLRLRWGRGPDAIEEAWFDSLSRDDTRPADVDGNDEVDAGDLALLSWFTHLSTRNRAPAISIATDGRRGRPRPPVHRWGRCP